MPSAGKLQHLSDLPSCEDRHCILLLGTAQLFNVPELSDDERRRLVKEASSTIANRDHPMITVALRRRRLRLGESQPSSAASEPAARHRAVSDPAAQRVLIAGRPG